MVGLSALVVLSFVAGLLSRVLDWTYTEVLFPFSIALFALVWMPLFLFYAYDRKQQRKESTSSDHPTEPHAPAGSLSDIFRNLHNPPPSESKKDSEE